jgi:pyruvate formate lyase activating enzyme
MPKLRYSHTISTAATKNPSASHVAFGRSGRRKPYKIPSPAPSKHAHKKLTAHGNENILAFARYLEEKKIPVWIRHIIVEGITDNAEDLRRLGRFVGSLRNLRALDVLPYHTMGVNKYHELGIEYPLEGMKALPLGEAVKAKKFILEGIKETRK